MTGNPFLIRISAILATFVALLVVGWCGAQKLALPAEWTRVLNLVRKQFPDVEQMSTSRLAELMTSNEAETLVLVDARAREEFAVSRLPGARNLTSVKAVQGAGIPRDAQIVVYCSVGYRSSALAQKLARAGFRNTVNLEGSLFTWANEARPLEDSEGNPTRKVHPYSDKWGRLLDESRVTKSRRED